MERRFKAAAFDLDGTLLDTSEGVLASVRYTIKAMGFPELPEKDMHKFIGPPIQRSFADAYGLEGDILQEIAGVFRDHYKGDDLYRAVPYEGIFDVFRTLKENGITPVVATYKRQDYAVSLLKHFGFDRYTDIICGADHENKLTKSDIIENALRLAGVMDYSRAVMIGDSDNDAIGAQGIGIPFIGVTYGFGFHSAADVAQFPAIGAAGSCPALLQMILEEAYEGESR